MISCCLRRDTHTQINPAKRHNERAWRILDCLHQAALASVRAEITSSDGTRKVPLDRSKVAAKLVNLAKEAAAVVVTGESGVGKECTCPIGPHSREQSSPRQPTGLLCQPAPHPPKVGRVRGNVGGPLPTLLQELSAPRRLLIIDGADAVIEGMEHAFRHLINAAKETEMAVVAVTSKESAEAVRKPAERALCGRCY